MKKAIFLVTALFLSMFVSAQVTIQMEKEGGVYKVPCMVNGVKMKFIFDTGASTVCMSQTMAQFLLDGEYLSISDVKGVGQSVVADGTIVNHAIVILRDIEIGGLHLKNIQATVLESQNTPLLLGQTAISELGRITIDGNKLIIHTGNDELSDEQINQLGEQARKYIDAESYSAAIECLERIDEAVGLSEFGLYELCFCYSMNNQYSQCIQACNRWISDFEEFDEYNDKKLIYGYLADSYFFGTEDYSKALLWYQKQMACYEDEEHIMGIKKWIAFCYKNLGQSFRAKEIFREYLDFKEKQLGYYNQESYNNIQGGLINNEKLGSDYYTFALIIYDTGDVINADNYVILASLLGYGPAKKHCIDNGLRYKYPKTKWNW
jgi:clan AA aspartic protease (TIGR02281 family)